MSIIRYMGLIMLAGWMFTMNYQIAFRSGKRRKTRVYMNKAWLRCSRSLRGLDDTKPDLVRVRIGRLFTADKQATPVESGCPS